MGKGDVLLVTETSDAWGYKEGELYEIVKLNGFSNGEYWYTIQDEDGNTLRLPDSVLICRFIKAT